MYIDFVSVNLFFNDLIVFNILKMKFKIKRILYYFKLGKIKLTLGNFFNHLTLPNFRSISLHIIQFFKTTKTHSTQLSTVCSSISQVIRATSACRNSSLGEVPDLDRKIAVCDIYFLTS